MDPLDYLRSIGRRWRIVLAIPVVAVAVAFITMPDPVGSVAAPRAANYTATATLYHGGGEATAGVELVKLFVQKAEIPRIAAETLGEDPQQGAMLALSLVVKDIPEASLLSITARDPEPERAAAVADAFADATIAFLTDLQRTQADRQRAVLEMQFKQAQQSLSKAARAARDNPDDLLAQAEKSAWDTTLNSLTSQIVGLRVQAAQPVSLQVLERAVAVPDHSGQPAVVVSGGGRMRLLMAGAAGLALGCVLALAMARFDTRPRSRAEVQDAYGLPVLAEVPPLPAGRRHAMGIEVTERPEGAVADGYRTLRSALMLLEPQPIGVLQPAPSPGKVDGPRQVVLVTSAREGEGKTSAVVNLAAALAEVGKQVLVVDCDLRNPQCHRFLDVPYGSGITDLVGAGLEHLARQTKVNGVRLVQAGTGESGHALLAVQMPHNVEQARELADVVLIDAPPVLAGNEAMDVMSAVDAVVVVARSGKATAEQVQRTRDMIARMQVPVYGISLVGGSTGLGSAVALPSWGKGPSSRSVGRRKARPDDRDRETVN